MFRLLRIAVSPRVVLLPLILVVVSLTACISGKVIIALDPAIDPTLQHTFAWEEDAIEPSVRGDGLYNIDHYLRREVNRGLLARGYRQVPRAQADFLVAYRLSQRVDVDQGGIISPTDEARSVWDASVDPANSVRHQNYIPAQIRHGNLELTLYAAGDNRILWRATLSKVIETGAEDSAGVRKLMEQQVPRMLRGFPERR